MRLIFAGFLVLLLTISSAALAQFKSQPQPRPSVTESLVRMDDSDLMFGFFDPNRLTMRHSFSLSYQAFGGQGLSMGVYTNSLMYKFSDPLDLQVDMSLMHSPFNSFSDKMKNEFSGVYLSRAQLNYRPTENMLFQIQYRQLPPSYWLGGYGYRSSNFFHGLDRYEEDRP